MDLGDLISPDAIFPALKAKSKKQALHELAQRAATLTGVAERTIYDTLQQRENLGSTGVGRGIAIPHGRVPELRRIVSLLARLSEPIAFDSLDGEPVDLIFLLLAPEHAGADHLKALARISRLFRNREFREAILQAPDAGRIYALISEEDARA